MILNKEDEPHGVVRRRAEGYDVLMSYGAWALHALSHREFAGREDMDVLTALERLHDGRWMLKALALAV